MVFLAEQGFFKKGQPFDPAWQEMLNHATMKVCSFYRSEKNVFLIYFLLKLSVHRSKPCYLIEKKCFNGLQKI